MMAGKMNGRRINNELFSTPVYNSIGDPYIDPFRMKSRSGSAHNQRNMHGAEFRPGGKVKKEFEHAFLRPQNSPNDDKKARTFGVKGFYTSPAKGGHGADALFQK